MTIDDRRVFLAIPKYSGYSSLNGMTISVTKHSEFDFKRVCFASPMKTPEKLYFSAASLDGAAGSRVILQTPKMKIANFVDIGVKKNPYIDLEIADDSFYQLLRFIDTHIIQHAFRNRVSWFDENLAQANMAVVEDCYRSPIRKSPAGPVVRFKLNISDGNHHTVFFENKKEIEISGLNALKDSQYPRAHAIVELRGLIMNRDAIIPDWVVHMLATQKSEYPSSRRLKFDELSDPNPGKDTSE